MQAVLLALLAAFLLSGCSAAPSAPVGAAPVGEDLPQGPTKVRIMAIQPGGATPLDEAVTIANLGSGAAFLTGWTLWDWDDNVYRFPQGFVLMPDATVTVHTGAGKDTVRDLHWGLATPVWDDSDQGLLRDGFGKVRHYLRYDGTVA